MAEAFAIVNDLTMLAAEIIFQGGIEGSMVYSASPFILYSSSVGLISEHDCVSEAAVAYYELSAKRAYSDITPRIYKWHRGNWSVV